MSEAKPRLSAGMSRPAYLLTAALPESGGQAARSAALRQISSYLMSAPFREQPKILLPTLPVGHLSDATPLRSRHFDTPASVGSGAGSAIMSILSLTTFQPFPSRTNRNS